LALAALLWRTVDALPRVLVVFGEVALLICAYAYSAIFADLGDTILGPPIVQEGLRAFVVVHILKALWQRWDALTPFQRMCWTFVATGVALNVARGHFSGTPLTLSFALQNLGLIGLTWRLMTFYRREIALQRERNDAFRQRDEALKQRDEALAELARLKGAA